MEQPPDQELLNIEQPPDQEPLNIMVLTKEFEFEVIALIDSGADLNCIQEGIIPPRYFRKSKERLASASGGRMQIEYDIPRLDLKDHHIQCLEET